MVFTMAFVFLRRGDIVRVTLRYSVAFPLLTNPLPLAGDKAAVFTMAFVFLRRGDVVRVTLRSATLFRRGFRSLQIPSPWPVTKPWFSPWLLFFLRRGDIVRVTLRLASLFRRGFRSLQIPSPQPVNTIYCRFSLSGIHNILCFIFTFFRLRGFLGTKLHK